MKFRKTTARREVDRKKTRKRFRFFSHEFPLVLIPPCKRRNIKRKEWKRSENVTSVGVWREEGDGGIEGTGSFAGCANSDGGVRKLRHGSDRSSWFLHIRAHPSSLPAISFRHPRTDIADPNRSCVPSCFNESAEFAEFKLGELRDTEAVPGSLYNHAMISASVESRDNLLLEFRILFFTVSLSLLRVFAIGPRIRIPL